MHAADFTEISNFIWNTADLIRNYFKRGQYQSVILPFTVLRRIDSVLVPTKQAVLAEYHKRKGEIDDLYPRLTRVSGYAFYNTSPYTFESLLDDAPNLAANLMAYINAFSPNMVEVLEKFKFPTIVKELDDANLLFLVMQHFKNIDLHPGHVPNLAMGYIFEDLIRRFNEALNENPGEHYTPREVIRLMVNLLLTDPDPAWLLPNIVHKVYDPCCGTGGMLTIARDRILELNPQADVRLFGQELNPETWAVCKSDMFLKSADGRDADNIRSESSLSKDKFKEETFNLLLTNPPYGMDWKSEKEFIDKEAALGSRGRFSAGTPRVSDGQLLFLQHLISKMAAPVEGSGGARIAIVLNGSPLFTGDAGSGESEIRRWILEHDWLEAIIALPEQLFYNTGIATYIWLLTNHKPAARRGKVQLIDATGMWTPMRKSLGDKRREIGEAQITEITRIFHAFAESERSKIFDTTAFGFRKITVERPLRLNFQASAERIARLHEETAFKNLAASKKKNPADRREEEAAGRALQQDLLTTLNTLPGEVFTDRARFEKALDKALRQAGLKPPAALRKAILNALSERDENAAPCRDSKGNPEPDPDLRDTENVPLGEAIEDYFAREVLPYVPDAWIAPDKTDALDGRVGVVGYEINFNRYFYQYQPPRPLAEIEAEIKALEREIMSLLGEMTDE
ncbi:MAG: SAM-dependent DNA methyltransferase [Anaerolineae bacterium]|nr:SAM-dependent DNA methyltransferase [Anaerolineae bacterium]